jgi:hypothetical protein
MNLFFELCCILSGQFMFHQKTRMIDSVYFSYFRVWRDSTQMCEIAFTFCLLYIGDLMAYEQFPYSAAQMTGQTVSNHFFQVSLDWLKFKCHLNEIERSCTSTHSKNKFFFENADFRFPSLFSMVTRLTAKENIQLLAKRLQ